MLAFTSPDLWHDASIDWYVKDETVSVSFAQTAGVVHSSVGPNHYSPGDALIVGSNGDCWAVTPERFEARYTPMAPTRLGESGCYRNIPKAIKAQQIHEPFNVYRSAGADQLFGQAGDWLVQYSLSDYGIVDRLRFAAVYKKSRAERGLET